MRITRLQRVTNPLNHHHVTRTMFNLWTHLEAAYSIASRAASKPTKQLGPHDSSAWISRRCLKSGGSCDSMGRFDLNINVDKARLVNDSFVFEALTTRYHARSRAAQRIRLVSLPPSCRCWCCCLSLTMSSRRAQLNRCSRPPTLQMNSFYNKLVLSPLNFVMVVHVSELE